MQIYGSPPIVPTRLGGRDRQRSPCNLSRGSNHRPTAADRKAHTYDLRESRTAQNSLDMASQLAIHSPRTICPPPDRFHAICAHFRHSDAPWILQTAFVPNVLMCGSQKTECVWGGRDSPGNMLFLLFLENIEGNNHNGQPGHAKKEARSQA